MSKTCKDCRWWAPDGSRAALIGVCSNDYVGRVWGDPDGEPGAMTLMVDRGSSPVDTGPDFGCVHWKCCVCDYQCHCENDE